MKTILEIPAVPFRALCAHLLPERGLCEEAAFLFVDVVQGASERRMRSLGMRLLEPDDFLDRRPDYLEMTDETRALLIKEAHDRGASLVEFHSHVGMWPGEFSLSDIRGLKETVPNLWWRLKGRPYAAVVVSRSGIDALAWFASPNKPTTLDEIHVAAEVIRPAHSALEEWP